MTIWPILRYPGIDLYLSSISIRVESWQQEWFDWWLWLKHEERQFERMYIQAVDEWSGIEEVEVPDRFTESSTVGGESNANTADAHEVMKNDRQAAVVARQ